MFSSGVDGLKSFRITIEKVDSWTRAGWLNGSRAQAQTTSFLQCLVCASSVAPSIFMHTAWIEWNV